MRKTLVILAVVALLGTIAAYERPGGLKDDGSNFSKVIPGHSSSVSAAGQGASKGRYKNGNFTGNVATSVFDQIQVAITVSGGKITKVTTPQVSGDSGYSNQINSYAVPQLNQQALKSQSASIDGISGASATTQAYTESLQSALDQAKV